MKIKWKHRNNAAVDITQIVARITWSGSVSQAARTAELSIIDAVDDKNFLKLSVNIMPGDIVELYENKEMIFYGTVQTRERKGKNGTVNYSCIDLLSYLLRSTGVYNFKNTTPERITKQVCEDFQIPIGNIVETKATVKKMIVDNESIYDIIMKAYTKADRQTGKKYICRMQGKYLFVKVKGEKVKNFLLEEKRNITDIDYQETIENMVNMVKIYNDKGKQIGEVKKEDWIENYGIYQQIYKKEKGVNEITAAKNLFSGVEKKISLNAIDGNLDCIAGNGITVIDRTVNLKGLFWIDSDSHVWENGTHTMSLELNFKNIMDSKE